jgi:hypothetical protein
MEPSQCSLEESREVEWEIEWWGKFQPWLYQ